MSVSPDDPRLTAFALGELNDDEAAKLRAELADHFQATEEMLALQEVTHELKQELEQEIGPGLTDGQLDELQNRIERVAIERDHDSGNDASGGGSLWYRLELWMPISAAIGFFVAVVLIASTTTWTIIPGPDNEDSQHRSGNGDELITDMDRRSTMRLEALINELSVVKTRRLLATDHASLSTSSTDFNGTHQYVLSNPRVRNMNHRYLVPMNNDTTALEALTLAIDLQAPATVEILRLEHLLNALVLPEISRQPEVQLDTAFQYQITFIPTSDDDGLGHFVIIAQNTSGKSLMAPHMLIQLENEAIQEFQLIGYTPRIEIPDYKPDFVMQHGDVSIMLMKVELDQSPNNTTHDWGHLFPMVFNEDQSSMQRLTAQPIAYAQSTSERIIAKTLIANAIIKQLHPDQTPISTNLVDRWFQQLPGNDPDRLMLEQLWRRAIQIVPPKHE